MIITVKIKSVELFQSNRVQNIINYISDSFFHSHSDVTRRFRFYISIINNEPNYDARASVVREEALAYQSAVRSALWATTRAQFGENADRHAFFRSFLPKPQTIRRQVSFYDEYDWRDHFRCRIAMKRDKRFGEYSEKIQMVSAVPSVVVRASGEPRDVSSYFQALR